jgi:uncharacterized iron-regulated protein
MINEVRRLAAAALLLAGCAAPTGVGPGPLVFVPGGDPERQAGIVARLALDADVVYLGEVHDNPHHHDRQRRVVEALVGAGERPALAFEMLPASRQAAVEEALGKATGAADLDAALGWSRAGWPDFAMYWPLFDLAQRHGLPVVATDLEPAVARRIAREGLGAQADAAALRSLLPSDSRREAAIARSIQEGHCDLLPQRLIPTMVESWHARNVTMARRLADALARAPRMVVIAGRGHQAAGGLTAQLAALRPGTRQLVVEMLEVDPGEDPEHAALESVGDIVWLTPPAERPDQCEELRRRLAK